MEWANGDVRMNYGREVSFSRIKDPEDSCPVYTRDYPAKSYVDYPEGQAPLPQSSQGECASTHCGYSPAHARVPYGVVHPDYHVSKSTKVEIYPQERQHSYGSHGGGGYRAEYPQGEPCRYQQSLPYDEPERGGFATTVCADCPIGTAPCEFITPTTCYSGEECQAIDVRTTADGRATSGIEVPCAESYPIVHKEPSVTEIHQECYDSRSLQSHHASHCDLREFQEWRHIRGSRESLSHLPPELEKHLRECRCSCDHLGYGNFQTLIDGSVSHISRTHSNCSRDSCGGRTGTQPASVYTQLSYLDSPRSTSSTGIPTRRKVPGELNTKHWCIVGLVFLVAATAGVGVGVPLALRGDPDQPLDARLETVKKVLLDVPLIDGHNDLPWNIRSFIHNQLHKLKLNESLKTIEPWSKSNWSHTDIPRLKQGMVGGQFWVAYTPCATQYLNAVQLTLEQIDLIKRIINKYNSTMKLVTSSQDIMKVFKEQKIASLIAIEGGHGISNSLGTLRMMYELGVRYMTLTHNCHTPWATSSIAESNKEKEWERLGLNEFGKKVVLEMNRLGMMVDLSHVSTQTMRDALATTKAPIIFSHSSARALCDNPRNVPDEILKKVKINGGIVMVSFYADHVSCSHYANVTHVAQHINHIRKIAGIDHIGIGADFDGINKTPEGLEDVSKYPALLAELMGDSSWTVEDVRKVAGENIIRVFAEVEKVRDELQAKFDPEDEDIHPDYLEGKTNCTYRFD